MKYQKTRKFTAVVSVAAIALSSLLPTLPAYAAEETGGTFVWDDKAYAERIKEVGFYGNMYPVKNLKLTEMMTAGEPLGPHHDMEITSGYGSVSENLFYEDGSFLTSTYGEGVINRVDQNGNVLWSVDLIEKVSGYTFMYPAWGSKKEFTPKYFINSKGSVVVPMVERVELPSAFDDYSNVKFRIVEIDKNGYVDIGNENEITPLQSEVNLVSITTDLDYIHENPDGSYSVVLKTSLGARTETGSILRAKKGEEQVDAFLFTTKNISRHKSFLPYKVDETLELNGRDIKRIEDNKYPYQVWVENSDIGLGAGDKLSNISMYSNHYQNFFVGHEYFEVVTRPFGTEDTVTEVEWVNGMGMRGVKKITTNLPGYNSEVVRVFDVAYDSTQKYVLSNGSRGIIVQAYDSDMNSVIWEKETAQNFSGVGSLKFDSEGNLVATTDGEIAILSKSGEIIKTYSTPSSMGYTSDWLTFATPVYPLSSNQVVSVGIQNRNLEHGIEIKVHGVDSSAPTLTVPVTQRGDHVEVTPWGADEETYIQEIGYIQGIYTAEQMKTNRIAAKKIFTEKDSRREMGKADVILGNGSYTFYSMDRAGNIATEIVRIDGIEGIEIDRVRFTQTPTEETTGTVHVEAEFPEGSTAQEIKINTGTWAPYEGAIEFTENGYVEARFKKPDGKTSSVQRHVVRNIVDEDSESDTTEPDIDINGEEFNDEYLSVTEGPDGSIYAVGYEQNNKIQDGMERPFQDAILVKYDKDLNKQWKKTLATNNRTVSTTSASQVEFLADGRLAILLDMKQDEIIVMDAEGENRKPLHTAVRDIGKFAVSDDGGIIFAETNLRTGKIVKMDLDGHIQWQHELENAIPTKDMMIRDVEIDSKGNVLILTQQSDENWYNSSTVSKISQDGKVIWSRKIQGNYNEDSYDMTVLPDDSLVLVGATDSIDVGLEEVFNMEGFVQKFDEDGNKLWTSFMQGDGNESFYSVDMNENGNLIVAGQSNSNYGGFKNNGGNDAILVEYSPEGEKLNTQNLGGSRNDWFKEAISTEQGRYVAAGAAIFGDQDPYGYSQRGTDAVIAMFPASLASDPDAPDIDDMPRIRFIQSTYEPTKDNVSVRLEYTVPMEEVVDSSYKLGNNRWSYCDGPCNDEIIVTENNTTIQADFEHTVSGWTDTFEHTVTNIDRTPPEIPVLTPSISEPTNDPVVVVVDYENEDQSVQYPDKNEYRVNSGEWLEYNGPLTVYANATIEARATDYAGNESEIAVLVLENLILPDDGSVNPDEPMTPPVGTDPTDPDEGDGDGTNPNEPGDGSDNGTDPTEPGDGSDNGGTDPTEPGEGSDNGGTDPTEPGDGTDNGGTDPTEPGDGSDNGGTDPTEPGDGTDNGGTDPTEPGDGSDNGGTDPTEPGDGSDNGGTDPTDPGDGTTNPGDGDGGDGGALPACPDVRSIAVYVHVAELSKRDPHITNAINKINELPECEEKAEFEERIHAIFEWLEQYEYELFLESVEKNLDWASKYEREPYFTAVQDKVGGVKDEAKQEEIQSELDAIYAGMTERQKAAALKNATTLIGFAERYEREPYLSRAEAALEATPPSDEKTDLEARFNAVMEKLGQAEEDRKLEEATEAVEKAETANSIFAIDDAQALVDELADGAEKDALASRIAAIEITEDMLAVYELKMTIAGIDDATAKSAFEQAYQAIENTESKGSRYTSVADEAMTALEVYGAEDAEDEVLKGLVTTLADYLDRVKHGQAVQAAVTTAENAITTAERYARDMYVTRANDALGALQELDPEYDTAELESRLQVVKDKLADAAQAANIANAEKQIGYAERYKRDPYLSRAQAAIDLLQDGDMKTALQERLDAVMN